MFNKLNDYETKINLMAGEFFISGNPDLVWMVLGSCIAIVFHCKRLKIGAIVHAQLPDPINNKECCKDKCPVKCTNNNKDTKFKYVSCSMNYMFEKFSELGIKKNEIDVKLFGGANVISHNSKIKTIGEKNVEKAMEIVTKFNLNLIGRDLQGDKGRTIYFLTDTGDVYVKLHSGLIKNIKSNLSDTPIHSYNEYNVKTA